MTIMSLVKEVGNLFRFQIKMSVGSKEWETKSVVATTISDAVSKYLSGLDAFADFPNNIDMVIRCRSLVEGELYGDVCV